MMKVASLIAAAGVASAWDLTLLSNNTWVGNQDAAAGGIYTFANDGGAWNNATGTCTVSTTGDVSFLNGIDLFTLPYQGGNQFRFADMSENDRSEVQFYITTDSMDAPAEDFMSVSCDNDDIGSGPIFRSFPNHPEEDSLRGSMRSNGDWGNFALTFPSAVHNLTFDDPAVVIGEEVGGSYAVDASMAVSDEIWFSAEWGDSKIAGSFELSATSTE